MITKEQAKTALANIQMATKEVTCNRQSQQVLMNSEQIIAEFIEQSEEKLQVLPEPKNL